MALKIGLDASVDNMPDWEGILEKAEKLVVRKHVVK
jgi:hypothetical protein